jgi:hypothetical protein
MKSVISKEDDKFYLHLKKVFSSINNAQLNYNWLITECDCYPNDSELEKLFSREYIWLTGEELTEIVNNNDFQWIWAVFSGFEKNIPLSKILKYDLPHVVENRDLYINPVYIQHPLAQLEILSVDGCFLIIKSLNDNIIIDFKKEYILSEDLEEYNRKRNE